MDKYQKIVEALYGKLDRESEEFCHFQEHIDKILIVARVFAQFEMYKDGVLQIGVFHQMPEMADVFFNPLVSDDVKPDKHGGMHSLHSIVSMMIINHFVELGDTYLRERKT